MTKDHVLLKKIIVRQIRMKLKSPFTTSFGTFQDKEFLLIEAIDQDGTVGWGESVAFSEPWYTEETVQTNAHIIKDFLIPLLFSNPISQPEDISKRFKHLRRNNMAKSAVEGAIWDLFAKRKQMPLSSFIGGTKTEIDVGISIGIQDTVEELLDVIANYIKEGYKRIKVKIKPGWDVNVIRQIRAKFPAIPLMADANSAYTLNDIDVLRQLDNYNLLMIEQPLAHDDILDHAKLQSEIATPICLDESIHSFEDARKAIELGACKIINLKIGRVGGIAESIKIHNYCAEHGVPVWCGGMLEAGVGRAHNIALTSLPQFILPGDTAGSSRYWDQDIIKPEVAVDHGVIHIPDAPGIGYEVDRNMVDRFTVGLTTFENN